MSDRDFNTTFLDGIQTELIIKNYFKNSGYTIIDRSNDKKYQLKDIDFDIVCSNNCIINCEVKSDRRMAETGNIVIELYMIRQNGVKNGWFHYCEATCLCYCDEINRIAYLINWKELKPEVLNINNGWRITNFNNKIDNCIGKVCLIPIEDLINLNYVKGMFRY